MYTRNWVLPHHLYNTFLSLLHTTKALKEKKHEKELSLEYKRHKIMTLPSLTTVNFCMNDNNGKRLDHKRYSTFHLHHRTNCQPFWSSCLDTPV